MATKTKKKRDKKYRPKTGAGMQGLLRKLPLSEKVINDSLSAMYDSLLRLKLGENKKGGDLMLLVVYLGIGWYLSERHDASMRPLFAEQIASLAEEARHPGPVSQAAFDKFMNFLPDLTDFLRTVSAEEIEIAHRAIQTPGLVPIMDDFLAENDAHIVCDAQPVEAGIASVWREEP